ncbi:MAG: hypothetical protein LC633_03175 [Desulfobulbaceae bacterium]|nr:hypothetical protein [Desulfobulbaceae bacterium]
MDVGDYCKNVDIELTSWKAKLYNIMRQMENLPTGEKQRVYEQVNGLNIIMTELEDRIEDLRKSCPTEWQPAREEMKGKIADLGDKYEQAEKALFDYGVGG